MKKYAVYILANKRNGTLYVGCSGNLPKRVFEHKEKIYSGFTKKYKVDKLVYYEFLNDPDEMIRKEKTLKDWDRKWKLELIEKFNPNWEDLYYKLNQDF